MTRRRRALALAALAAAAVVALSGCGLAAAPPTTPPATRNTGPLEITAFQPSYADRDRIDASADGIDVVAVAAIALVDEGARVSTPTDVVLRHKERAEQLGKQTTILVTNSRPGTGFSRSLADGLLSSPEHRVSVALQLADIVRREKWSGVMLDLEALSEEQADGLTAFARDLRAAVGPKVRLESAIPASSTPGGYRDRGHDVAKLARYLDHMTVMAYDQHGTYNPTNPGPVGAIDWQRGVVDAITELVPPRKVDLGVPGYGYRWGGPIGAKALGDPQARRLVAEDGATAVFDPAAEEWTATLSDGSVFWWADARSLETRIALAKNKGLHGVAVWSLAVSDPIARHDG